MFKKYTIIVFTWLTLFMEAWCFLITWQMIFTTDLTFNNQIYMYELSSLMHHWYHSIIQYPCTRCLRNTSVHDYHITLNTVNPLHGFSTHHYNTCECPPIRNAPSSTFSSHGFVWRVIRVLKMMLLETGWYPLCGFQIFL